MVTLRYRTLFSIYLLILYLCSNNLYSGEPDSLLANKGQLFYNFSLTNSVGINFDKSKPVFFIDFLKNLNTKFSIGFRFGVFTYYQNIQEKIDEILNTQYGNLPPGYFQFVFDNMKIDGITHVFSANARYRIFKSISFNLYIGAKQFTSDFYRAVIFYQNSGEPTLTYFSVDEINPIRESKIIIKAYYSIGVNYHLNRFEFGVYGDNIYSLGLNLGTSF